MSARAGSSASRLASAQPRYCVFASSRRSAPIRSASATNSATRAMLPRWMTTFSVSGSPSARAAAATSSFASQIVAPGDPGGAVRVHVLHRELHAVEPRRRQLGEPGAIGGDAAGDQVDVELLGVRRRHQRRQIGAHQRLAAGQVHLQHAQRRRVREHRATRPPVSSSARGARAPAGSSSSRTQAGSGRSARRPACTAAVFRRRRVTSRPAGLDRRAHRRNAITSLSMRARGSPDARGQLVHDRRDRPLARRTARRCARRCPTAPAPLRVQQQRACPRRDRVSQPRLRPPGAPARSGPIIARPTRRLHAVGEMPQDLGLADQRRRRTPPAARATSRAPPRTPAPPRRRAARAARARGSRRAPRPRPTDSAAPRRRCARDIRSGANISVSDDATATTSGLSRHRRDVASHAKRTPGSTRRQLATSSRSRPTASASRSHSASPPVSGCSASPS